MFVNKTAFILGAGASWHYGYPLGEQLVREVISRAKLLAEFSKYAENSGYIDLLPQIISARIDRKVTHPPVAIRRAWSSLREDCQALHVQLAQANPLVIDYFLGHSDDRLKAIGRFLIAWIILECDARYELSRANQHRKQDERDKPDDWCRFILYKLTDDCRTAADINTNDVTFVTFNYDVSLERQLHAGLSSIGLFSQAPDEIAKFFKPERFLHVYGRVRDCPPVVFSQASHFAEFAVNLPQLYVSQRAVVTQFLDEILIASEGIKTIHPHEKDENDSTIRLARDAIAKADCIYILGYGFDGNNNKRLSLEKSLCVAVPNLRIPNPDAMEATSTKKCILFTNFGDRNQINKQASNLIFNRFDWFLPSARAIRGDPTREYYVEKSIRDVYGALAHDFDSVEAQRLFQGPERRIDKK